MESANRVEIKESNKLSLVAEATEDLADERVDADVLQADESLADKQDQSDDAVDGIFVKRGKYNPRKLEVETWGPSVGKKEGKLNPLECVMSLIQATSEDPRWRRPLNALLAESSSDIQLRENIVNLLSCAYISDVSRRTYDLSRIRICLQCIGIELHQQTVITSVKDGTDSANLNLGCSLTTAGVSLLIEVGVFLQGHGHGSPGSVVLRAAATADIDILTGLHRLLLAFQGTSPTNMNYFRQMSEKCGLGLLTLMNFLEGGYGIDLHDRAFVDETNSSYPYLMTSLGFRAGKQGRLLWERPTDERKVEEYNNLITVLHGLFYDAQDVRTDL